MTPRVQHSIGVPSGSETLRYMYMKLRLSLEPPEMKIFELANSVNRDEAAHNERPHLDLHCLSSSF